MIASEQLGGTFSNYHFRWLVSCKHFAASNKAVSEDDERNVLERVESFHADGFLGVYSTLPTANWHARLEALRDSGKIRDFRILDGRAIERYLLRVGYASLLMRFYPESYKRVRPLHAVAAEYVPLQCKECGKDLLYALFTESYNGLIGYAYKIDRALETPHPVEHVYAACKGPCDSAIERRLRRKGLTTAWLDVSDLASPLLFLQYVFSLMNSLRDGSAVFADAGYDELRSVVFALAQKVLRESNEEERERFRDLDAFGVL